MKKTTKTNKKPFFKSALTALVLGRIANALVVATKKSQSAGDELLYRLPGVFSMTISYGGRRVRLIKEANTFRIMEKSEKSDILLAVEFADGAALCDVFQAKATWAKILSEGRLRLSGNVNYAAVFLRVAAESDRLRAK